MWLVLCSFPATSFGLSSLRAALGLLQSPCPQRISAHFTIIFAKLSGSKNWLFSISVFSPATIRCSTGRTALNMFVDCLAVSENEKPTARDIRVIIPQWLLLYLTDKLIRDFNLNPLLVDSNFWALQSNLQWNSKAKRLQTCWLATQLTKSSAALQLEMENAKSGLASFTSCRSIPMRPKWLKSKSSPRGSTLCLVKSRLI